MVLDEFGMRERLDIRTIGDFIPDTKIQSAMEKGASKVISENIYQIKYIYWKKLWEVYLDSWSISTPQLLEFATENGKIWIEKEPEPTLYKKEDDKLSKELFDFAAEKYTPGRRFICELKNCCLVGPLAIPFLDGHRLILEPFGGDQDLFFAIKRTTNQIKTNSEFYRNRIRPQDAIVRSLPLVGERTENETEPKNEAVFRLFDFSKNYGHWIRDNLPKLRMLSLYEDKTGIEPTLLIRSNPEPYRLESLSLLGFSENRISEWEGGERYVDRLVITNHRIAENSLQDYKWLRDECLPKVKLYNNNKIKKIYVSRQQAQERKVSNYRELEKELDKRGFDIVVAESLSFREQIKVFHSADIILGPHGAGMANIMWGDDPLVIELFPENYIVGSIKYFADILGFHHEIIVSESTPNRDLVVNIHDFCQFLDNLGV